MERSMSILQYCQAMLMLHSRPSGVNGTHLAVAGQVTSAKPGLRHVAVARAPGVVVTDKVSHACRAQVYTPLQVC